jgi:hypothetical protein
MRLNRLARHRQGQSTVEVMLVISVLVVAIVAAGFVITNENNGFIAGMRAMSDGAGTVFAKKPD